MCAPKVVMVVDDDPVIRELLADVIRDELGAHVLTAYDGEDGLRLLARVRPALVLTDAMMPRLGGLQLAGRVRDDRRLDGVPVVAMSAAVDAAEAIAAGCAELLPKPFDLDDAVALVRRYLG